MVPGFARTAVPENRALQFQSLDIQNLKSHQLAEMILHFHALCGLSEAERDRLLWAVEPEVILDAADQQLVPRLRPIAVRNNRYNPERRPITQSMDIRKTPVILERQQGNGKWLLTEVSKWALPAENKSHVTLVISHAVSWALRTSYGHRFLVLGRDNRSYAQYLALVPSLLSVVQVPKEMAVVCPDLQLPPAGILTESGGSPARCSSA
ncbi:hypothetical protein BDW68DRAFT_183540 [Aspergillus falconensis]